MRQLIDGVQRIYSLSGAHELDTLRLAVLNIACLQVGLRFVQRHVKLSGARPIDIPVLVTEFRLVHDSGPMNFRCSTFDIVRAHVDRLVALGLEPAGVGVLAVARHSNGGHGHGVGPTSGRVVERVVTGSYLSHLIY